MTEYFCHDCSRRFDYPDEAAKHADRTGHVTGSKEDY